jgi:hypothetical protein
MRRRVAFTAAGLAAAGAASLLAVTLASAGHSSGNPIGRWSEGAPPTVQAVSEDTDLGSQGETLVLIENENQGQSEFIDVGEPGFSPGDYNVFRDPLYDDNQQQIVGYVNAQCMFIFARFVCHGVVELTDRGKITFEGSLGRSRRFLLALTGGAHEFKTVDGQVRIATGTPSPGFDTLTFQIIKD